MRNRYRAFVRSIRQERTDALTARPIVRISCASGTVRRETVQWTR